MRAARQPQELLRLEHSLGGHGPFPAGQWDAVGRAGPKAGWRDRILHALPSPPRCHQDASLCSLATDIGCSAGWHGEEVVQERFLLAQAGEVGHGGGISVSRQTRISRGSGEDDTVAPGLHGKCWEGAAPPKPPPHVPLISTPSPRGESALLSPHS